VTASNPVHLVRPVPKRVVVVGAGIAGMTAAQELAERGYEVEVIEKTPDPYNNREPLVGGMARTSWARLPSPVFQDPSTAQNQATKGVDAAGPIELKRDTIPLPVLVRLAPDGTMPETCHALERLLRACQETEPSPLAVSVTVCTKEPRESAVSEEGRYGYDDELLAALNRVVLDPVHKANVKYDIKIVRVNEASHGFVQVAAWSDRVPGEHGFRFFPSFYRHLFDSMKRIPVPEAALGASILPGTIAESDSSRSVFDNLASSDAIQIGLCPATRTFDIQRHPYTSLEELRRFMANALERAGYRGKDLYRLATRYVEYMASSPTRRWKEYEKETWADFIELDALRFSPYFVNQVQSGSQCLVAMSSTQNDARTMGSIAIALMLDQIRAGSYSDGTLKNPTSTALFWPWQNYLRSLGVTFTLGTLVGFTVEGMAVRPAFGKVEDQQAAPSASVHETYEWLPVDPADYYVITVPAVALRDLFSDDGVATCKCWRAEPPDTQQSVPVELSTRAQILAANEACLRLDILEALREPEARKVDVDNEVERNNDLTRYLNAMWLTNPTDHPDAGPLRYMTGIQFYFDDDVKVVNGHTLCLDSPWGVSYLSQVQYWQDRQRGENGVRGVVSAIFTKWETPARQRDGAIKTALQCTPDQIAERVWADIKEAWDTKKNGTLPKPKYYYIDEGLTYVKATGSETTGRWTNTSPYLVNNLNTWEKRPGSRRDDNGKYEYKVQLGHTVFAGAFMRTVTRLNTMEAANESARRAVNAILARELLEQKPRNRPEEGQAGDADAGPSLCALWDLEDYELPDFLPLRDLDGRIFRRGGRNIVRSEAIEAALRATPWDLVRLGLPTYPDPGIDR
jgi:uncharacterized protein with NAD-binding domain and iron-sulfur cluster